MLKMSQLGTARRYFCPPTGRTGGIRRDIHALFLCVSVVVVTEPLINERGESAIADGEPFPL